MSIIKSPNVKIPENYDYLKLDPERPVCFLDLDGVLNNYLHLNWPWYSNVVGTKVVGHDVFHPNKADLFFALMHHCRCQVVIVSSWTNSYLGHKDLRIRKLARAFDYDDIKGSVATVGSIERSRTVRECVNFYQLKSWVVVDDTAHFYRDDEVPRSHRVHPHGRYGITDQDLESIEFILRVSSVALKADFHDNETQSTD